MIDRKMGEDKGLIFLSPIFLSSFFVISFRLKLGLQPLCYRTIAAIASLVTGRITPRSQIIAAINSAGVTSKAGL